MDCETLFFIKRFAKRWYNKDACVLIYIYFLSLFLRSVFSFCVFFHYLTLFDFKTPFVRFICRQNIEHVSRLGFSCWEKKYLKSVMQLSKFNKFVRKILNINRKRLFTHFVIYFCATFYNKNIQISKQLVFQ